MVCVQSSTFILNVFTHLYDFKSPFLSLWERGMGQILLYFTERSSFFKSWYQSIGLSQIYSNVPSFYFRNILCSTLSLTFLLSPCWSIKHWGQFYVIVMAPVSDMVPGIQQAPNKDLLTGWINSGTNTSFTKQRAELCLLLLCPAHGRVPDSMQKLNKYLLN